MEVKIPSDQLTSLIFSMALAPFRFAVVQCPVAGDSSFLQLPSATEYSLSVLMSARIHVHDATLRFVLYLFIPYLFIPASSTITSSMTAMTAVTEHVHREKGDEDQHPEPVFRKPCHDVSPSGLSSRQRPIETSGSLHRRPDHDFDPGCQTKSAGITRHGGGVTAVSRIIFFMVILVGKAEASQAARLSWLNLRAFVYFI